MPVHSVDFTGTVLTICLASNDCQVFDIAGFIGEDSQAKADAVAEFVQENYLDVRQTLNTLPNDDPDRTTNPDTPTSFWEGDGSPPLVNTTLVSRTIEISIEWTGSEYITALRRLN
jgi:hypothetical protein